ncbi:hypothetical protein Bca4012_083612 [Brassica carinata]
MGRSKRMMKHPMEEVYGKDAVEGFSKGKKETEEHYMVLLRLANEHRQSESVWHEASRKVNAIAAQIELLDDIIKAEGKFVIVAELEKLTAKHIEAEANLDDVKVKIPDWFKLGKNWMMDD